MRSLIISVAPRAKPAWSARSTQRSPPTIPNGSTLTHVYVSLGGTRSPADPTYDPFWARVAEAGVVVVLRPRQSVDTDELISMVKQQKALPLRTKIGRHCRSDPAQGSR